MATDLHIHRQILHQLPTEPCRLGRVYRPRARRQPAGVLLVGSTAASSMDVPVGLLFGGRVLRSCVGGNAVSAVDRPQLMRLMRAGRPRPEPLMSARIPLEQINAAIERQRAGEVARSLTVCV